MRRFGQLCSSGDKRHRIVIEKPTDAQESGYGGSEPTWSTFKRAWASIDPLTAREILEGQAVEGQATHRIKMRYVDGLKGRMRFTFRSRTFELVGPPLNPMELNEQYEFLVRETETA